MGGCGAVAGIAHKSLITLRNAQVRRISWVRGVRPVRGRYEWPPHDAAPDRPPFGAQIHLTIEKGRPRRPFGMSSGPVPADLKRPSSLDLGFAELDVLLGDRIVFPLGELVGHGARVLAGHIVEA